VITAPSFQFKGAGWYVTDYGGKKSAGGDGDKADKPATETKEAGNKEKDSRARNRRARKRLPKMRKRAKKEAGQEEVEF